MMGRVLVAESMKLRRTFILPLVFLAPFGVIGLNVVRIALTYTRLLQDGDATWGKLVLSVNSLLVPALILGTAILASMIAAIEHRGRMWKQLGALPVQAAAYYTAKTVWLLLLLGLSSVLCMLGTLGLGMVMGLGPIPWAQVLTVGIYPYLAAYGLIALQLFLSVFFANQAYGITAGVLAVLLSYASFVLPTWLPWIFPKDAASLALPSATVYVGLGVGLGLLLWLFGAVKFQSVEHH